MLEALSPHRVASPILPEKAISQLKNVSKMSSGSNLTATIDMADEVNPPLTFEPVSSDIPVHKIYGEELPTPEILENADLLSLSNVWVSKFNQALNLSNYKDFDDLFLSHASWKDHLSLTWSHRQFHGVDKIKSSLSSYQPKAKLKNFTIDTKADVRFENSISIQTIHEASEESPIPIQWVQVVLKFENDFGFGLAFLRLVAVENKLKALALYTGLENIKGNEESKGLRRPLGVDHGQHEGRSSWLEKRDQDFMYGDDKQPTVLIVGGGQGGLNTAARLKCMGIDCLIVEKNPNIGDNWRNRYKFLVLHDPVWYDHLSYINFPDTWPVFTPKDKLGDWFDSYAKSMELSYWTSKTVAGAEFDDLSGTWTIKIIDNDSAKVTFLKPKHLVMSTGHSGEPNVPHFKQENKFKGQIVHSSKHTTGKMFQGENAIILGCCNSGHDIAQDFYEQGAKPIIVQRSSTCVINSETGLEVTNEGLYEENGPPVEIADLTLQSMPLGLLNLVLQQQHRKISQIEKPMQDSLKKAGFKLDSGYGGTGLFGKYFRRGGGYYIDVGCSKLISEGNIAIKQGVTIDHFTENGVVFTDGSEVDNLAIVVLATGYSNMKETARKIFGDKVADRLDPVWGLNDEGEVNTMWGDSGHPNFYYMGGNLHLARYYSKKLALKIIAKERGFDKN